MIASGSTRAANAAATAWLAVGLRSCGDGGTDPPPGDPPSVESFEIIPTEMATSGAAVLQWRVSDALSVEIQPGIGTVEGSRFVVRPAASTTYSLRAENDA